MNNMRDERLGFALFGTGRIGKVHLHNLILDEHVNLLYVIEEDTNIAEKLVEKYHLTDQVTVVNNKDSQRVYQDQRVKVAMICTPSFTHENLIINALNAGFSVFCEKPLAPSIDATKACYDLAERKNLTLFCAFNRNFDPQLERLQSFIKEGKLGTIRKLHSCSRDPVGSASAEYIKTSGGIFIDTCVHDIDQLVRMTGERPDKVFACGHATDPLYESCNDVDTCAITLTFPCGAIGTIEVSRNAPTGYDQRVEVLGSNAMMISENKRNVNVSMHTPGGSVTDPIIDDCCVRYADSYQRELQHFINVLKGKEDAIITKESVLATNIIANACKKSLETSTVININYDL